MPELVSLKTIEHAWNMKFEPSSEIEYGALSKARLNFPAGTIFRLISRYGLAALKQLKARPWTGTPYAPEGARFPSFHNGLSQKERDYGVVRVGSAREATDFRPFCVLCKTTASSDRRIVRISESGLSAGLFDPQKPLAFRKADERGL